MNYLFKIHTGPVGIQEIAEELKAAKIQIISVGTEHIYVNFDSTDQIQAKIEIRRAISSLGKFQWLDPRCLGRRA